MTGPPAGPVGLETLVQGRKSKGAAAAAPFGLFPAHHGRALILSLWKDPAI